MGQGMVQHVLLVFSRWQVNTLMHTKQHQGHMSLDDGWLVSQLGPKRASKVHGVYDMHLNTQLKTQLAAHWRSDPTLLALS